MSCWSNQDAQSGNFSKPWKAEVPKGVENRFCGSRFFCTCSNASTVTFSLNAAKLLVHPPFFLILVGRRGGCAQGRVWRRFHFPGGTEVGTEPSMDTWRALGNLGIFLQQHFLDPTDTGGSFPCRAVPCLALPGFLRLPAMEGDFCPLSQPAGISVGRTLWTLSNLCGCSPARSEDAAPWSQFPFNPVLPLLPGSSEVHPGLSWGPLFSAILHSFLISLPQ